MYLLGYGLGDWVVVLRFLTRVRNFSLLWSFRKSPDFQPALKYPSAEGFPQWWDIRGVKLSLTSIYCQGHDIPGAVSPLLHSILCLSSGPFTSTLTMVMAVQNYLGFRKCCVITDFLDILKPFGYQSFNVHGDKNAKLCLWKLNIMKVYGHMRIIKYRIWKIFLINFTL